MNFAIKFNCIDKALSEQLTSQEDIKELLAKESDILSKACCDADRRLETLDQTVKDLEVRIEDQSHSIVEVSKCAVQLLGRISDLTNSLGAFGSDFKQDEKDRTISEDKHTSNKQQQKDDRKTNTQCPHTFVVQHDSENSSSRTYMNLQTEQRNCSPFFVLENSKPFTVEKRKPLGKQPCNIDKDTISVENELRKDSPIGTNERRGTTDPVNTKDRDGEEAPSSNVYNSTQSQSLSSVDTACSGRAKHDKRSLFKNDFGYKQKHTESEFDNRISFHNKKVCFQGISLTPEVEIPSESQDKPNIKLDDSSSDRMIAMALEEDRSPEFAASSLGIFTSDDSDFGKPKTINEWLSYANEIRQNGMVKGMNGLIKRGNHGHNYVLVLDCSLRMKGQKFHTMIRAAKAYINGVRDVWVNIGLQDNIGLAVFGEKSSLITESTCDYDMLLKEIDGLTPSGEAPLVGGLLMGFSGVLSGSITCMNGFQVQGFVIVFTDCQSENTTTLMDSQFHTTFYQASRGLAEARAVLSQAVSAGIKIFYVPVEERCTNKIMEMALEQTQGKRVKPHEMYRLVKMTQTLGAAARIASELRFNRSELSREMVSRKVLETTGNNDTDDCVDLVFDLLNPRRSTSKNEQFTELNCKTLSLGDRVRRGPHWEFGDQDSNLPGTVIGQGGRDHVVRVRWDSGDQNVYFFDENSGYYSIEKISNYRKVVDDLVAVGCRVQRGNDWTFDDEDGGRGCKGTVLDVNDDGTVIVRWDCRKIGSYKIGNNSLFEIELSEESYFSPSSHSTAPNPDLVNEDDFQGLNEDVKIDKYIIPVASNCKVEGVWEYRNEDEWRMFSPDIQKRLEKIYSRNSTAKPILEIDSVSYCFDFRKMRKTHPQTRKEVEIRRKSLSDA